MSKITKVDKSLVGKLIIPDSVTDINGSAFYDCSSLTSIKIPNSVKINFNSYNGLFENCSSLTSIDMPNGLNVIGDRAFMNCSSLTSIDMPNGLNVIGNKAFMNCSSLISINIPDSVININGSAFYNCSSLTSIKIPNSVTYIGKFAFEGCSSLISANIPNGVTRIYDSAFRNCSSLTSINIPNDVTRIEMNAFNGCSSLTSLTIPDSVTYIGEWAFERCFKLPVQNFSPNTYYRIVDKVLLDGFDNVGWRFYENGKFFTGIKNNIKFINGLKISAEYQDYCSINITSYSYKGTYEKCYNIIEFTPSYSQDYRISAYIQPDQYNNAAICVKTDINDIVLGECDSTREYITHLTGGTTYYIGVAPISGVIGDYSISLSIDGYYEESSSSNNSYGSSY